MTGSRNLKCSFYLITVFHSSSALLFLKISAQESRRKKKEYMDCLERKMDNLHSELGLFKSKCSTLEEQNAGLMSQIKRLQV